MKDTQIIFSGPMVKALLKGRKTQTRRVLKPQPEALGKFVGFTASVETATVKTPYAIGDRLYVRETLIRQETDQGVGYQTYAADGADVWPLTEWRHKRNSIPSIHMPRWASRLTLLVTHVRVQRLQDISEADAKGEGCMPHKMGTARNPSESYRLGFSDLWNSLHGPDAWAANPWVVAVSFDVQRGNIDAVANP